jgi:hypothetical protein
MVSEAELALRGALTQVLQDAFAPTGLAFLYSIDNTIPRGAPTWRYERPAALGTLQRLILGKSIPRTQAELVAGVLAEDGRRLVLSLERELSVIVPQCTQPIEAWLSLTIEPLISKIEENVELVRERALETREERRRVLEDRNARLHQLLQIRTELRGLADGK